MNRYKAYHTSIKTCFALGIHQKLLPEHFLSLIPPSTSHYWKKQNPSQYLGDELALKIESSFEDVNTLLDQRAIRLRKAFVAFISVNIEKKIALRDVVFSNSIVEAPYRILKSRYFQNRPILSTTIQQELDFFVNDYNNNRPHYAHILYTPNEVAQKPELLNVKPTLQRINRERLENNRAYCCKMK